MEVVRKQSLQNIMSHDVFRQGLYYLSIRLRRFVGYIVSSFVVMPTTLFPLKQFKAVLKIKKNILEVKIKNSGKDFPPFFLPILRK